MCGRSAEPAGAPLSLVVATQGGVERAWPAGGGASNRSLDALGVRALDFHYSNRYVHTTGSRPLRMMDRAIKCSF